MMENIELHSRVNCIVPEECPYHQQDEELQGFYYSDFINKKSLNFEVPLADPFVNYTVEIGWWDRFRSLFRRRKYIVNFVLGADQKTLWRVMNIDRARFPVELGNAAQE